ncbi:hypothetical protein QL285_074462 [Trifolium repens]|nr:hypothetical protein QL285_074462 [Trifolium repens]
MATPTSNIETSDKLIILNASTQLSIKLYGDNYPTWRFQFMALLTGYDLMSYVDSSKPCPPKVLANDAATCRGDFRTSNYWLI